MQEKNYFFSLENKFAECKSQKHSANNNGMLRKKLLFFLWKIGLPSVIPKNTRQTIILCRVYFEKTLGKPLFCRVSNLTLGKPFAECVIKTLGKYRSANTVDVVCCLSRVTLGKAFAECFFESLFPVVILFSGLHYANDKYLA